jgi:tetratricopeptide (TPR) repeat protein
MRGELVRGEQLAESALKIGSDAGEPDAILIYGAQLTDLRDYQGRGEEVIGLLEESVAAYPRIPAWSAGLARTYAWLERREEAAAIVEQAAADGFDHVPWDWIRLPTLGMYADAASHTGLTRAAGLLYELIEPWADQVVWVGVLGFGHSRTYLGVLAAALGWDERADEHLAFACEFNEANGLTLWAARAQVGWAEALASRGATERAQEHAARALELSREHGFGLFEKRAVTLLTTQPAAPR